MSEQLQNRALDVIELEGSELSSLLQKEFKPKTDEARSEVESAVLTLAQQALEGVDLVGDDVVDSIERMIAAIDQKLSVQINEIIHHADFQQMESAWRGLNYLVNNTETDEFLKIGFKVLSESAGLAQFYDRDTTPEMAKEGMKGFQEFMVKPDREKQIRKRIEKVRKRIFKK